MDWFDKISKNARKISIVSLVIIAVLGLDFVLPKSSYTEKILGVESTAYGRKNRTYRYKVITPETNIATPHITPGLQGYDVHYRKTLMLKSIIEFEVMDSSGKVVFKSITTSFYYNTFLLIMFGMIVLCSLYIVFINPKENVTREALMILTCWIFGLFITLVS